jgi:hypothetical protein
MRIWKRSGSSCESAKSMSDQSRQLFGTDGIRGVAGEFPLTAASTYLIGRALGHDLMRATPRARATEWRPGWRRWAWESTARA